MRAGVFVVRWGDLDGFSSSFYRCTMCPILDGTQPLNTSLSNDFDSQLTDKPAVAVAVFDPMGPPFHVPAATSALMMTRGMYTPPRHYDNDGNLKKDD